MNKKLPLIDQSGEVRELTRKDLSEFKSASEALPSTLIKKLGVRGPQKSPKKVVTTIRLSPDVLEKFKATGTGWQTRIDKSLKLFISEHPIPN
jgi:uncharacterized protein (DUF4415 family)